MEMSNWINLGILGVTAVVGILAWLGARKSAKEAYESQKQANGIQARLLAIEETRHSSERNAQLSATLQRVIPTNLKSHRHLVITNKGGQAARNIRLVVDGKPVTQDDSRFSVESAPESWTIGGGSTISIRAGFTGTKGFNPPINVEIRWDDDSGTSGHWESTLNDG